MTPSGQFHSRAEGSLLEVHDSIHNADHICQAPPKKEIYARRVRLRGLDTTETSPLSTVL
jgi:hypothetical protein